jgi:hypothetical protein
LATTEIRRNLELGIDLATELMGFEGLPIPPIERDPQLDGDDFGRTYGIAALFFINVGLLERPIAKGCIWLRKQGCAFSFDLEASLANLRARPPRWRDEYSGSAARSAFNEADGADQLFQYYLLDTTGFEPNVFTTLFPEMNERLQLTVTGASCGLPTVGACESRWNPSLGFRPILTTRARSG